MVVLFNVGGVVFGYFEVFWYLNDEWMFFVIVEAFVSMKVLYFMFYLFKGMFLEGGWFVMLFGNGYWSYCYNVRIFVDVVVVDGVVILTVNVVGYGGGFDGIMIVGIIIIFDGGRSVDGNIDGYFSFEEGMGMVWDGLMYVGIWGLIDGVWQIVVDNMVIICVIVGGVLDVF